MSQAATRPDAMTPEAQIGQELNPSQILEYSDEAISLAIEMIEQFPRCVQRLTESYDFSGDLLRGRVDLDIRLPARTPANPLRTMETLLLPVIVRDRDRTLHNLKVGSEQPLSVSMLSRAEADELIALVLEVRYRLLFPSLPKTLLTGIHGRRFQELLGAVRSDEEEIESGVNDAIANIASLMLTPSAQQLVDMTTFANICKQFCHGYFQVIELTGIFGMRVRIHYTFDGIYEENDEPATNSSEFRYLERRRRAGLRPFRFSFSARNALRASSYHFVMKAFDGFYLADADLFTPGAAHEGREQTFFTPRSLKRIANHDAVTRSPLGAPFVHYHVARGNLLDRNANLRVRVKFYEIPPGTLGVALALNSGLALALTVSLFLLNRIMVSESAGSDFPLLFLAIPATCSLWLQFSGASTDRARGALAARIGIWLNAAFSALSIVLFLVGRSLLTGHHNAGFAIPAAWLALTLASFATVADVAWRLRRAIRAYRSAARLAKNHTEV